MFNKNSCFSWAHLRNLADLIPFQPLDFPSVFFFQGGEGGDLRRQCKAALLQWKSGVLGTLLCVCVCVWCLTQQQGSWDVDPDGQRHLIF